MHVFKKALSIKLKRKSTLMRLYICALQKAVLQIRSQHVKYTYKIKQYISDVSVHIMFMIYGLISNPTLLFTIHRSIAKPQRKVLGTVSLPLLERKPLKRDIKYHHKRVPGNWKRTKFTSQSQICRQLIIVGIKFSICLYVGFKVSISEAVNSSR